MCRPAGEARLALRRIILPAVIRNIPPAPGGPRRDVLRCPRARKQVLSRATSRGHRRYLALAGRGPRAGLGARAASANRVLVDVIEAGLQSEEAETERFFALADRLAETRDSALGSPPSCRRCLTAPSLVRAADPRQLPKLLISLDRCTGLRLGTHAAHCHPPCDRRIVPSASPPRACRREPPGEGTGCLGCRGVPRTPAGTFEAAHLRRPRAARLGAGRRVRAAFILHRWPPCHRDEAIDGGQASAVACTMGM